ncbi:hypothetical protein ASF12_33040 [Paenibacillus sp. Leaf72]|nr:hypothetical protein ASF12_33040 [Paenibacillus sp. Leaf72]
MMQDGDDAESVLAYGPASFKQSLIMAGQHIGFGILPRNSNERRTGIACNKGPYLLDMKLL